MCRTFLIFKSNLELALSIILRERELYELKHVPRTTASTSKLI